MTRFVADAIGVRSGAARGPTKAQRKKALEEYARTGRLDPALAGGEAAGPSGLALPSRLPDPLLTRPHVFLDVEGGGKTCEDGFEETRLPPPGRR